MNVFLEFCAICGSEACDALLIGERKCMSVVQQAVFCLLISSYFGHEKKKKKKKYP